MRISVRIFGVQELVEKMGNCGEGVVEFSGGTMNDLFGCLLSQHGFTWADFPLLKNWEENLSIFILHNDDILCKADYGLRALADGDRLAFHIHTGCC
ncbi:MAG TPA: hypothetical protein VLM91_11815 [Candidatus Methylomirabilis sp.]|nr:hypothetical protein [Candidatus Methylomirabilis sp.]